MLRSLATGAVAVPLLWRYERLLQGTARADDPVVPKRFVLFWNPQGHCSGLEQGGRDPFWPTGPSGSDFTMSRILTPLERHRQDMLLLHGFHLPIQRELYAEECGPGGSDGAHGFGCRTLMTGACPWYDPADTSKQMGGGPSIDQIIAQHVGDQTFRPSVSLIAGGNKSNHRGYVNYAGANEPITPIREPLDGFHYAIGEAVGADRERVQALRAQRASALDLIRDDIQRMRGRLPAEGRYALDAHLESLRVVERDYDGRFAECSSEPTGYPEGRVPTWDVAHPLHFRTISTAIACDQSRVFSLMSASGGGDTAGDISYFDPTWETNYHSTGHASGGNRDGGGDDADTRAHALEVMIRVSEFYAEQLASFIDQLKAIPEVDGTTAFDNTVVYWATEMAHGNHGNDNVPQAIFGGSWHFTQGHYHAEDGGSKYDPVYKFGNILTALAQSMGVPTSRVGSPMFFDENLDRYASLWSTSG